MHSSTPRTNNHSGHFNKTLKMDCTSLHRHRYTDSHRSTVPFSQPLTIQTNIEYDLDYKLFPGYNPHSNVTSGDYEPALVPAPCPTPAPEGAGERSSCCRGSYTPRPWNIRDPCPEYLSLTDLLVTPQPALTNFTSEIDHIIQQGPPLVELIPTKCSYRKTIHTLHYLPTSHVTGASKRKRSSEVLEEIAFPSMQKKYRMETSSALDRFADYSSEKELAMQWNGSVETSQTAPLRPMSGDRVRAY